MLGHVREAGALLSEPRRFLREAVTWQAGAWLARVAVAFAALHAFGLPASLLDAVLVVVVTGLAGVIPFLPGGVGAQQAMLVYALRKTASAASVVTFGVGMQLGVTLVDLTVGVIALLITFRTLALRNALRASRRPRRSRSAQLGEQRQVVADQPADAERAARSASCRWLTGHVMTSGTCARSAPSRSASSSRRCSEAPSSERPAAYAIS